MNKIMYNIQEIEKKIKAGKNLILAGNEKILEKLPTGNWIGGTTAYFMCETGGVCSQTEICASELPGFVSDIKIKNYDDKTISNVYADMKDNSFNLIIIPGMTPILHKFALNGPNYENFGINPLIGWVSGVHIDELEKTSPKVFNGSTGEIFEQSAVVMQIVLPKNKIPEVGILNIFDQGRGDIITFAQDGFSVTDAFINGERCNLAKYLLDNNINTELPLVADYYGIMVNVSFQAIDDNNKIVWFYAPVFKNVEYKIARTVDDYMSEFTSRIPDTGGEQVLFSCNCVLNYLFSNLEGKETPGFTGPITFGEIAYQLLNQTLIYVIMNDI